MMQSCKMRLVVRSVSCVARHVLCHLAVCCAVANGSLRRENRWVSPCIARHVGVACVVVVPQCGCSVLLGKQFGHVFESRLGTRFEVKHTRFKTLAPLYLF